MPRTVPFFHYPGLYEQHKAEFDQIISGVLSRGAFIMQRDLEEFENSLADYLHVSHAIGVADGTMALLLGCLAADLKAGDEVIVPSHTFVASASAIHHAGATPVLCDCGPDHLIDPQSVRQMITAKTKAIMPVQLNGRTANMDPILAIANEYGLRIIEDSCQALGSSFRGQFAGTFGEIGTFSFFPAKTLGCFGDGGAVVTNNDEIANQIRVLRDHGRVPDTGIVSKFGYNARLDNIQAAILSFRLKRYKDYVSHRRAVAEIYDTQLSDIPGAILPPGPDSDPAHFDVYQNYEIEVDRRDELRAFLSARGIGTILQWGGRCLHQFENLKLRSDCAYTEMMTRRFLMLPMSTVMSLDDAEYVAGMVREFYALPRT